MSSSSDGTGHDRFGRMRTRAPGSAEQRQRAAPLTTRTPPVPVAEAHRGVRQRMAVSAWVMLVCPLALTLTIPAVAGQTLRGAVSLNSSVDGTTVGAAQGEYSAFSAPDVGGAGQVYYTLEVPEGRTWRVTVSTCAAASFDTYIAVFSSAKPRASAAIAESNNDATCAADTLRSATSVDLKPGSYAILVTGSGLAQGTFKLEVKARLPGASGVVPWGLDRIDQRTLPLDGKYKASEQGNNGAGITVYVLDSGVRSTHEELAGRVTEGFDFVTNSKTVSDCTGFGTHAAGVIAGKTYGVAKQAKIVSVRILDCQNTARVSHVTSALEWIILNVQFQPARQVPAIVYMRFHSGLNAEVDDAVRTITKFGIPVIAPAGDNGDSRYCNSTSPAHAGRAIMVGSTDRDDRRSSFSNYGPCTNLFAPGRNITSADFTSDTATVEASGTALAAAHVAGAAALLMSLNANVSPQDMRLILTSLGTVEVVKNATGTEGKASARGTSETPPRLAFVRSIPRLFGDRNAGDTPAAKTIFVYFVVEFLDLTGPATDPCSASAAKHKLSGVLDVNEEALFSMCFGTSAVYRVTETDRRAAGTSSRIQQSIGDDRDATGDKLGTKFEVVEEPWFVDSNGFTYWSQPQFEKNQKALLTAGAIAGIVVGAALVIVVVGVMSYAMYRHIGGVDDIESMEGSADFEKGPTHFHDYAGHTGPRESNALQAARSFRNVVDGIGRSLSMRGGSGLSRPGSRRGEVDGGGGGGGRSDGISRMDSYMGEVRGAEQDGGTDILRMRSYGGEAFAGLGAVSRANSVRSSGLGGGGGGGGGGKTGLNGDQRMASFRGAGQMMGLVGNRQESGFDLERMESEGPQSMTDVRMHSMGGEAFAMLARGSSNVGGGGRMSPSSPSSSRPGAHRGDGGGDGGSVAKTSLRDDSYAAEALAAASDDPGREPSFFSTGRS
jgi:Subtilase family